MITIRIEGDQACQGTTMVGQHLQLLLAEHGYDVTFESAEHSARTLAARMDYLKSSPHLRQTLTRMPVRIIDHHTETTPHPKRHRLHVEGLGAVTPR